MGIITVVISDELENEIRRLISSEKTAKKGALSKLVEDALWAYIRPKLYSNRRVFKALKDNRVVAEASSLNELAEKPRNAGIDPREVKIFSSISYRKERRIGLRGSRV